MALSAPVRIQADDNVAFLITKYVYIAKRKPYAIPKRNAYGFLIYDRP